MVTQERLLFELASGARPPLPVLGKEEGAGAPPRWKLGSTSETFSAVVTVAMTSKMPISPVPMRVKLMDSPGARLSPLAISMSSVTSVMVPPWSTIATLLSGRSPMLVTR